MSTQPVDERGHATPPAKFPVVAVVIIAIALVAGAYFAISASQSNGRPDPQVQTQLFPQGMEAATVSTTGSATSTAPVAPTLKATNQAIIKTAKGDIVAELYGNDAPKTVANFVKLSKKHFYRGLKFHRVEPGFVIQGGDPKGDGTGGPGYSIKLEIAPNLRHWEGALAMARTNEPDTAGSQFYITLAETPNLDNQYAVFGRVIKGMDVVKKIAKDDKMTDITIK